MRSFSPDPRSLLSLFRQLTADERSRRRFVLVRSKIVAAISLYARCLPEAFEDRRGGGGNNNTSNENNNSSSSGAIVCFKVFDSVTRQAHSEHPLLALAAVRLDAQRQRKRQKCEQVEGGPDGNGKVNAKAKAIDDSNAMPMLMVMVMVMVMVMSMN